MKYTIWDKLTDKIKDMDRFAKNPGVLTYSDRNQKLIMEALLDLYRKIGIK